jgi:poly(3-hydroxybutyrate) depolymerase
VRRFTGEDGRVRVEQVLVDGMAHGLAIDPAGGCGAAAPFMLDVGLCSSRLIAQFWGIADGGERPASAPRR